MSVRTKHNVLRTSAAIGIGLAAAIALILITASEPGEAVHYFLVAPFLSRAYFSHLIEVIIPLLFTGSAVCIMFSANQFNLGLEGAFYLGGLVAAVSGIYFVKNVPVVSPLVGISLGGIIGAIITTIPALLQHKWRANVLVSSLMMNYVCLYLGLFLLFHHFKDPASSQHSYPIGSAAALTPLIPGTKIHSGLILAAVVTFFFVAAALPNKDQILPQSSRSEPHLCKVCRTQRRFARGSEPAHRRLYRWHGRRGADAGPIQPLSVDRVAGLWLGRRYRGHICKKTIPGTCLLQRCLSPTSARVLG